MLDILVIAPHPDDAELGMAGSIVRFKEQGLRVGVLDLTSGEPTPHRHAGITGPRDSGGDGDFAAGLARESGAAESQFGANARSARQLAEVFRRVRPTMAFRAISGSTPIPTTWRRRS